MILYAKILNILLEIYECSSMNLVKLQNTKLKHRNLLQFYILTTKDQKKEIKPFTIELKKIIINSNKTT